MHGRENTPSVWEMFIDFFTQYNQHDVVIRGSYYGCPFSLNTSSKKYRLLFSLLARTCHFFSIFSWSEHLTVSITFPSCLHVSCKVTCSHLLLNLIRQSDISMYAIDVDQTYASCGGYVAMSLLHVGFWATCSVASSLFVAPAVSMPSSFARGGVRNE